MKEKDPKSPQVDVSVPDKTISITFPKIYKIRPWKGEIIGKPSEDLYWKELIIVSSKINPFNHMKNICQTNTDRMNPSEKINFETTEKKDEDSALMPTLISLQGCEVSWEPAKEPEESAKPKKDHFNATVDIMRQGDNSKEGYWLSGIDITKTGENSP